MTSGSLERAPFFISSAVSDFIICLTYRPFSAMSSSLYCDDKPPCLVCYWSVNVDVKPKAIHRTVSPLKSPACFVSQAAASLCNAFTFSQDRVNQIYQLSLCVCKARHVNKIVLWPGCEDHARCILQKRMCNWWKEGIPLGSYCVECVVHHKRDVRVE